METTKLFITDSGDPSVGMFPCFWTIEVPFTVSQKDIQYYIADPQNENVFELYWFKGQMIDLYEEYCDGRCTAYYDFENTNDY